MSNSETSTTSIGLGSVIEEGDMVSDEEKNIDSKKKLKKKQQKL